MYACPELHGNKNTTVHLTSGTKSYYIGIKRRKFNENWIEFVRDHDLQQYETIVFLPQANNSYLTLIFNEFGIERLYPWHFKFKKL